WDRVDRTRAARFLLPRDRATALPLPGRRRPGLPPGRGILPQLLVRRTKPGEHGEVPYVRRHELDAQEKSRRGNEVVDVVDASMRLAKLARKRTRSACHALAHGDPDKR